MAELTMEATVYTLPNCLGCRHIKSLMDRATDVTTTYKEIGSDISKTDFDTLYPKVTQTPFTVLDGVEYENLVQVARKLLADGKVTPPTE